MNNYYEEGTTDAPYYMPEQFIWYMFECLCIVGLLLERGEIDKNPMSDWIPIVHRDLKLSNVFLSLPNDKHYSRYPVPKVGDFGLALHVPDGGRNDHGTFGTPGNLPIEQDAELTRQRGLNWPLTTKANVWGVGNIIASLITLQEGFSDMKFADIDKAAKDGHTYKDEPRFSESEEKEYSKELLDLVFDCMRFDPNERFNFAQVLRIIRTQAGLLRDEPPDSDAWVGGELERDTIDMVRTP